MFDLWLGMAAVLVVAVPVLRLALAVRMTSPGPALYGSDRVGPRNQLFQMPTFRSVCVGTPAVARHVPVDPEKHRTRTGDFLH